MKGTYIMTDYNIYIDAHINEKGLGGWALVLTSPNGNREFSHHMGVLKDCTEGALLLNAIEEAVTLTNMAHAIKHRYTLCCQNEDIVKYYNEGVATGERPPNSQLIVIHRVAYAEGAKTARVLSHNAYKFHLAGGFETGVRAKVKVTPTEQPNERR